MSGGPWIPGEAGTEAKRHAPATLRNRDAIADVLADLLPARGTVLEIASGSGEHAVHFAARFPALRWQPSDPDPSALASIAAWSDEAGLPNIAPPLMIDAAAPEWAIDAADTILCANMVHISPWEATLGLMAGAGRLLPAGAPLILYGPYLRADVATAPSNLDFDASLKARDSRWGLRALEDVAAVARDSGLALAGVIDMPANNIVALFRRL